MKRFLKETLGACGRMLLEIFLLFPALLVLGNALLGKTVMLPVFFAELAVTGLSGVLLRRFISSAKILPAVGAPLCIGAVCAAGIAGEKCCTFISDDDYVGEAVGCDPQAVFKIRIPYAIAFSAVSLLLYLIAGFLFR